MFFTLFVSSSGEGGEGEGILQPGPGQVINPTHPIPHPASPLTPSQDHDRVPHPIPPQSPIPRYQDQEQIPLPAPPLERTRTGYNRGSPSSRACCGQDTARAVRLLCVYTAVLSCSIIASSFFHSYCNDKSMCSQELMGKCHLL